MSDFTAGTKLVDLMSLKGFQRTSEDLPASSPNASACADYYHHSTNSSSVQRVMVMSTGDILFCLRRFRIKALMIDATARAPRSCISFDRQASRPPAPISLLIYLLYAQQAHTGFLLSPSPLWHTSCFIPLT